jgi:hypothetical protein
MKIARQPFEVKEQSPGNNSFFLDGNSSIHDNTEKKELSKMKGIGHEL